MTALLLVKIRLIASGAFSDVLAVEMEGAAMLKLLPQIGLPFMVIRAMGDTANMMLMSL